MVAKLAIFSCLVAAAAAIAVPVLPVTKVAYAEPEAPAQYDFSYSVHDTTSGDIKQQKEVRSGDVVQGSYSLVQPDGVHRIVDYTSDKVNGFNAVVRYEGQPIPETAHAKIVAPVAKLAYTAPVAKVAYGPAPITYAAAPVAKVAYAPAPITYTAPVAKVAYAQAPINYAAPIAKVAYAQAPINYAAPIAKLAYAQAPVAYASAPVAKVAYSAPLGHVTFSSPAVSYQH